MSRNRVLVLAALLVLLVAGAELLVTCGHLFDLGVYRLGAEQVVHHTGRLYDVGIRGYPFTYPPAAALALAPLALVPLAVLRVAWTAALAATLAAVWWISFRAGERGHVRPWAPRGRAFVVVAGASVALLDPLERNFHFGQVNLVLTLVVLLDLLGPVGERRRGVLSGLAAAVKLTPLVFLVLLALTRQWRALRHATLTFGSAAAAGFVLLPAESWRYWTDLVVHTSRIGPGERASNQSVMGVLLRLGAQQGGTWTTVLWFLVAGTLGAGALLLAAACWRRGEELLAVSLAGLAGLLASPVSWTHHWVWCVPLGVGLVSVTRRRTGSVRAGWGAAAAWWSVFVLAPQRHLPHGDPALTWGPVQQVLGSCYPLVSVLAMAYVGWLVLLLAPRPSTAAAPVRTAG